MTDTEFGCIVYAATFGDSNKPVRRCNEVRRAPSVTRDILRRAIGSLVL